MSEETATKHLRELLDERGMEWWEPVQMEGSEYTRWHDANGMEWTTSEIHGSRKLRIGASFITPEQAIAATLGCGTCHIVMTEPGWWECDECGSSVDWDSCDPNDPPSCDFCPSCGRKVES